MDQTLEQILNRLYALANERDALIVERDALRQEQDHLTANGRLLASQLDLYKREVEDDHPGF